MIGVLESGVRVVNVDETLLKTTSFFTKTWGKHGYCKYSLGSSISPGVAMIAAIDTDGAVFFTVSTANTNARVIQLFLNELRAQYQM